MKKAVFIKDIMRPPRPLIHLDMALSQILETMDRAEIEEIYVVEKGNLRGVVNKEEALKQLSPFIGTMAERTLDRSSLIKRAHQIMKHHFTKIHENESIFEVAKKMQQTRAKTYPIMNDYNNLVGFITYSDMFDYLFDYVRKAEEAKES